MSVVTIQGLEVLLRVGLQGISLRRWVGKLGNGKIYKKRFLIYAKDPQIFSGKFPVPYFRPLGLIKEVFELAKISYEKIFKLNGNCPMNFL